MLGTGAEVEGEAAEGHADDEGGQALEVGAGRDRRGDGLAVTDRTGEGGSRATEVARALRADADHQHQPERRAVVGAERHRDGRDLARSAAGLLDGRGPEQVDAGGVAELGRAGAQRGSLGRAAVGVRRDQRDRDHLDAGNGVGAVGAERELGRRDLGRDGQQGG